MSRDRQRLPAATAGGRLAGIGRMAVKAPRRVVAVWIVLVASLAVLGVGIEHKLTIHVAYVPGSESARAHEIVQRDFGNDEALVVMLHGPHSSLERQGSALAARLGDLRDAQVVSPWTRNATIAGLQPSPSLAALVLRAHGSEGGAVTALLRAVRRQVRRSIDGPVHASVAGFPVVLEEIQAAGNEATRLGEEIAVPVLALVLLLVFRSALAALLPVVVGGAVVGATRGVLDLMLGLVQVDLFAVGVAGMMGLALGVDYSLLVVSRYREERARAQGDAQAAVIATVGASVRSIVPAGTALILAMLASALVMPSTTVRSIAIAVVIVAVLSMISAICVLPALLCLLGERLDRWSLPQRRSSRVRPLAWIRATADHPRAVVLILLGMLLLSVCAFTLRTGVGGIGVLPADSASRVQQEEVARSLGAGWTTPFEVVIDGRGRPITLPGRMRALAAFQSKLERDPGVRTVAGLAQLDSGAKQLLGIEHGLHRLQAGIAHAHRGATRLRSAASTARAGAQALTDSLRSASAGSAGLTGALNRAGEGSADLASGLGKSSAGAGELTTALRAAQEQSGQAQDSAHLFTHAMSEGNEQLELLQRPLRATEEGLSAAWQALQRMNVGRGDPEYAVAMRALEDADRSLTGKDIRTGEQASSSYAGLAAGLERAGGQFGVGSYLAERLNRAGRQADAGMAKLLQASAQLRQGLLSLAGGSTGLSSGVATLDQDGAALSPSLQRLSEGSEHLSGGLRAIATGAGSLASGLGEGAAQPGGAAARRSGSESAQQPAAGEPSLAELQRESPGLLRSPYIVLAALDGSRPQRRSQIAFFIDLEHGGEIARMTVIPRQEANAPAAARTLQRIQRDAAALAARTGTEVLVGGAGPFDIGLDRALRAEVPLLRLLLSLISMLVLIPVMRSLTMPAIAAAINALTVAASIGLLALLCNGSLLGGPGYVEASILLASMMVMFGLAIDYEVFVFARIREEYVRTGSTNEAVRGGLDSTAHVVTGAAIIMITVFLAFAVLDFAPYRDFGVAQALAVFIDAFIVRLIVIPAIMRRLGRASWWMPSWPGRILRGRTMLPVSGWDPGPRAGRSPGGESQR